jgi:hypothetical protein
VFEAFRAAVIAEVEPRGIIEETLVGNYVRSHWDALRWARYKENLLHLSSERTRARLAAPAAGAPADALIVGETDIMMCGAFAAALGEKLSLVERLDVLLEKAEGRCASALRELHRHREALAAQAQRATQRVEDAEFRTLEDGGDKRLKGRVRKSPALEVTASGAEVAKLRNQTSQRSS